MSSNNALLITDIDFDNIKSNFKNYLKTQTIFNDYDFEGSNLSVLLDLLSYNTYMNNFYLNLTLSEMFLDSAQLRDSVISHVKELNYVPRSFKSSVAYVDINIYPTNSPSTILIPKATKFTTKIDNRVYNFNTAENIVITPVNSVYKASNVALYEGQYVTERFVVNSAITDQRFVISNPTIDLSSLSVVVQNSTTDQTNTEFNYASSFLGYNSASPVYFLQGSENNKYEVVFGKGSVGKPVVHNNIIYFTYRIASGAVANGARIFLPTSSISGYSNVGITLKEAASGGAESESVDSIKYNAPRFYQTQERAVTAQDYKVLVLNKFPEIEAINVYGGEEAVPPEYGKVIIVVDIRDADGITNFKKTEIEQFIKSRSPLSITPKVVTPEFLFLKIETNVKYNTNKTTLSSNDIKTQVLNAISSFRNSNLNDFNVTCKYSKVVSTIDNSHNSIISNDTNIKTISLFTPELNRELQYTINIYNKLRTTTLGTNVDAFIPAISSTEFTVDNVVVTMEDNGNGILQLVQRTSGVRTIIKSNIGTIDYDNGILTTQKLNVTNFVGSAIKIYGTTALKDISANKNILLDLDLSDVTVNVIQVVE